MLLRSYKRSHRRKGRVVRLVLPKDACDVAMNMYGREDEWCGYVDAITKHGVKSHVVNVCMVKACKLIVLSLSLCYQ